MTIVTFVASEEGDWVGMYVDGRLACEGHSIDGRQALEELVGKLPGLEQVAYREVDFEAEGWSSCPAELEQETKNVS